jgi:putative endonuclease
MSPIRAQFSRIRAWLRGLRAKEPLDLRGERAAAKFLKRLGYRILAARDRSALGEIDLVALEPDGTLVFVEVRVRRGGVGGGAAASVGPAKQARLVYAARAWLATLSRVPPCRFDVVAVDGDRVEWLKAAFDER